MIVQNLKNEKMSFSIKYLKIIKIDKNEKNNKIN